MDKNKKDFLTSTVLYQFIFCALLVLLCLILAKNDSPFFTQFKNTFSKKIENNALFDEAVASFSKLEIAPNESNTSVQNKQTTPPETTEPETNITPTERDDPDKPNVLSTNSEVPANASLSLYSFNKPMQRPVNGEVTSSFGMRVHPIYNVDFFHTGLDIAADEGTPVKSAFDGTVVFSGESDSFGNYIEIEHGNSINTLYCHLEKREVSKGDKIKSGQEIGLVGQTGVATGPHLHFEIQINGVSYDPYLAYENAVDGI